jgi:hypothetical protein
MLSAAAASPSRQIPQKSAVMPSQLGKRYTCEHCGGVFLVVKGGEGVLQCHGTPVVQQIAKQLPASD